MSTIGNRIQQEQEEKVENIDYKMVTFSLAGKDYGIDIMKVKEISKAKRFTYVPNAEPYVRGVYNLRGDIISMIDLRIMFNLPAQKREDDSFEDMIILRLDVYLIGIIVDEIDKVVGINSESIQPPHPIFGDINIKFIKGVVENEGRLYLILDVEKILGDRTGEEEERMRPRLVPAAAGPERKDIRKAEAEPAEIDYSFISESLQTFSNFYVTDINRKWFTGRFEDWKQQRGKSGEEVQLQEAEDAAKFLRPFYSAHTGAFWSDEYRDRLKEILKDQKTGGNLLAWNPGCGEGYETYSLAATLKEVFPQVQCKIWAHDNDLLNISTAPNLIFNPNILPDGLQDFTVEGKNGLQFNKPIRDAVLFEYHDVLHANPFPEVDLIFARDILSFQTQQDQNKLVLEFNEKLKPGGLLFIGENEELKHPDFENISSGRIQVYRKIER
ncbi:MAG: CheR family methyltransferase [Sediminispirochaetaceae bacterium]